MIRKIELGGQTFQIASLTFAQVEAVLDEQRPARERAWLTIRSGLANADPRQTGDPTALDVEEFQALQEAILDDSSLTPEPPTVLHDPQYRKPDLLSFDALRARLCTHCGWTVEECDRTPFRVVHAIFEYWQEVPSVDLMFSSWIGYKPRRRTREYVNAGEDSSQQDKINFVRQWGGKVSGRDNLPSFMQETLARDGLLKFGPSVN